MIARGDLVSEDAVTVNRVLNELGNFKSNLSLVQNNLEREKFYLFKSFQGLSDASSRSLIASLGDSVERLLFDKHSEFDAIEHRLSELVERWRLGKRTSCESTDDVSYVDVKQPLLTTRGRSRSSNAQVNFYIL